jgi:myo-inositol-1(or 4)-monophosphatase
MEGSPKMSDLDLVTEMARATEAAAALLRRHEQPTPYTTWPEFKSRFDTIDDLVGAELRERLEALCPGVPWSDEMDTAAGAYADECWVVDAVDGAVQYLQGLPQWCVSVSLVRDGRALATALHSATLHATYTAAVGGGAFLNGTAIVPSAKKDLSLALVTSSHPPFASHQPDAIEAAAKAVGSLLPAIGALRNLGPTSWQIADVASGRVDAFWQYGLDPGNLIGAALIAGEAGAVVTDVDGAPWQVGSPSFLAAAPGLHARLVELLPTHTAW